MKRYTASTDRSNKTHSLRHITMYIEITGPAIRTEYDSENKTGLRFEAEICKEIEIEEGNPNLDFYFDHEFLIDHQIHYVNGERWELDLAAAEVSIDVTVAEIMRSANNRVAEDFDSLESILEYWNNYRNAPEAVNTAYMTVMHDTAPPQ